MRYVCTLALLVAAVVLAGNAVSVGPVELSEHNAHWQQVGGNIGCVRDGMTIYGSNDSQSMWCDSSNLSSYDGAYVVVHYSLATADGGDNCYLYDSSNAGANGRGYDSGEEIHTFADQAGMDYYVIGLDDFLGGSFFPGLYWESNAGGVDDGFRMDFFAIWGADYGDGTYDNIFIWNSDMHQTHETHVLPEADNNAMSTLSFYYDTDGYTYLWYWCIDNVEVYDGVTYFTEDFSTNTWYQIQYSGSGVWEIDTDHLSGNNWQADSDDHSSWTYDVETLSPWFYGYNDTTVTAEFDSYYENYAGYDYAWFGYYYTTGTEINDRSSWGSWTVGPDDGTNVVETSWGFIKANQ